MNPLTLIRFGSICLDRLEIDGLKPEMIHANVEIEKEARNIGKDFVTPTLSSTMSDFTYENSFWITLRHGGDLRAVMGVRYDELGSEPISKYFRRAYKRQYGARVHDHPEILPNLVGRNKIYMGDLFFHPEIRGSIPRLMSFVHLAHCLCFTQWRRADYIYAFHRRADVLRGKTDQYGFGNRIPGPQKWEGGPDYRSDHEYLAVLSQPEFMQKATYYVEYPDVFLDQ